jgi:peptidyl-prolyl cis-trans isomerase C
MNYLRILPLIAVLAAFAACQPKAASGIVDSSPPVATVNGVPITRDFYEFYVKGITQGKSPADLTPQQRSQALDNLIRGRLAADEAEKEGLARSGDPAFALELTRLQVLNQALEEHYLKDRKPTDQEVRAEYETEIASLPKTEYHARHILVATEPFAQQLIARLDKGEKFDALAKEASMDSSKNNGGDLGWFTPNRMVPEFSGAVIALKPGEYTKKPVHTQYGWHVIQLLETRDVNPPTFDQVRQRLEQVEEQKKFRLYTDELEHNAKIERLLDQPTTTPEGPAPAGNAAAPGSPAAAPAPANTPPAAAPAATPTPPAPASPPPKQ